jgi:flagellar hook protein FlgE
MSLFGSLTASVSGLTSPGEAISVISDNLSNLNTIGYKSNRALFQQMVTSSGVSGTLFNAGGTASNILRAQNIQGALVSTQSTTDLALSGSGFFVVTDNNANDTTTSTFYSRAGSFAEDSQGFLVSPNGNYLNGWRTESDGTLVNSQAVQAIELQSVGASARATTTLAVGANLDSGESAHTYDTSTTLNANLLSVVGTPTNADYVTDARIYDSQGKARDVSVAFVKRAYNSWDWTLFTDGGNVFGGTSGTNSQLGSGTLRFDSDGKLKEATGLNQTVDWADGVSDGSIALDFGNFTGGRIATADGAGGMEFGDAVLDIAVEDESFALGQYTVRYSAANTLELVDSGSTVVGTATLPATNSVRNVEFASGGSSIGVRVTLDDTFATSGGAGPFPVSVGTFTVSNLAASGNGDGTDGIIQFASAYNTAFIDQNGFGSGTLNAVTVDSNGFLIGNFTNGETKKLWKVAVAVFQNPSGLDTISGSLLRETDLSGRPLLKEAGVAGTASMVSGSLEQSTVDIAGEFSNMIVAQRAYQAGSTVISTVDQMLNELMQLR